jgi:hypothetical protein
MLSSKTGRPIDGLREDKDADDGDYRRVTPQVVIDCSLQCLLVLLLTIHQVWSLFEEWYGGGPAISFVGPPSVNVRRWTIHVDGIVGNHYDNEDSDSGDESEDSEEAMVHIDGANATPDELHLIAEMTRF